MDPPHHRRQKRTYGKKRVTVTAAVAAIFGTATSSQPLPQSPTSPSRPPLADITSAIGNINLNGSDSDDDDDDEEDDNEEAIGDDNANDEQLKPLVTAYKTDRGEKLIIKKWADVLAANARMKKIAEASYAEVYRITNNIGTSIIKIMELQLPKDPGSLERRTALKVGDVVSEIRIMNAMTEVPEAEWL